MICSEKKTYLAAFLLVAAAVFYLFNVWTPMMEDDYYALFNLRRPSFPGDDDVFTTNKISSTSELVQAYFDHRQWHFTGRISDYIYSAIVLLAGKCGFNLLNALVFILAVAGVCRWCFRKIDLAGCAAALLALLAFLPKIAGTLLWACGACNYLWGTLPLLLVLHAIRRLLEGKGLSRRWKAAAVCCAFACGALHEALGSTLSAGLVLFRIVHRGASKEEKWGKPYTLITLAAILGALVTVTAPSMWQRAARDGGFTGELLLPNILSMVRFSAPLLIVAAILVWRRPTSIVSPLGGFILANSGLCLLFGSKGSWGGGFFYLNFGLILFILQSAGAFVIRLHRRAALSISLLGILAIVLPAVPRAWRAHSIVKEVLAEPKNGQTIVVDVSEFGNSLPFPFQMGALPLSISSKHAVIPAWHGQQPFNVSYRNCRMDPSACAAFGDAGSDEIELRRISGSLVVRLPRGWKDVSASLSKGGKKKLMLRFREWAWTGRLLSLFLHYELGYLKRDFHDGYLYLILPPAALEYEHMTLIISGEEGVQREIQLAVPQP